jgi:hypothetical protein
MSGRVERHSGGGAARLVAAPVGPVPAQCPGVRLVGDEQLTLSTVPVLAFIDAADPIEQPRNWAGAQKFFPNSRAIALPRPGTRR